MAATHAPEGMQALARFGFRDFTHAQPSRPPTGRHIPTLRAEEAELTAIAHALRTAGTGWLQIVSDFQDQQGEIEPVPAAGEGITAGRSPSVMTAVGHRGPTAGAS